MARRRGRGYLNDVLTATAESDVRFGPKKQALAGLVDQARSEYASDVKSARAGARSSVVHARKARKPLAEIYDQATGAADSAASDVETAFGKLGAAADPFRAATAREQGATTTRLAVAKASGLKELADRQTEAKVGRQFAVQQAKTDFKTSMKQLASQLTSLGDEQGAYVAARLGALGGERAQRRFTAGQNALNRAANKDVAEIQQSGGGKDGKPGTGSDGGPKPATQIQTKDLSEDLARAVSAAKKLQEGKLPVVGKKGKVKVPARPPMTRAEAHDALLNAQNAVGDTAARIALDIVYDDKLSSRNLKRMRQLGYSPADLEISKYLSSRADTRHAENRADFIHGR